MSFEERFKRGPGDLAGATSRGLTGVHGICVLTTETCYSFTKRFPPWNKMKAEKILGSSRTLLMGHNQYETTGPRFHLSSSGRVQPGHLVTRVTRVTGGRLRRPACGGDGFPAQ